jgi:DNA-binding MarR family transcriptional regulator
VQLRTKIESDGRPGSSTDTLPLSTLLSQVLVAFTIEFDNEAERQIQHRTTRHGSSASSLHAPWLVSLVMWANCMQFVGEEGIKVGELERLARIKGHLNGMERWGYIHVAPDPADSRPKPPRADWLIRATAAGKKAQEVWRPLSGVIEKRWRERYGEDEIERLRESLGNVIRHFELDLPDCLPILGYGLFSKGYDYNRRAPVVDEDAERRVLALSALLSRALLAFALEFESESDLSLAISANVLRILDVKGVRVQDLPHLSGVSKEAISMAMGILQKNRLAVAGPDPGGSRAKVARLTPKGEEVREAYRKRLRVIEERWRTRYGEKTIRSLRESLERLVGEPTAQLSPLSRAVAPYPDGWRAKVRKPDTLPHYPMVLHRGGFPDGS